MASFPKTKTTNKDLFDTIRDLKKHSSKTGEGVWRAVAETLAGTASQRAQVNLRKIEKVSKTGETLIVPGKILGDGVLTKKVTIVAYSASEQALERIEKAGSTFVEIKDYLSKNPDKKARIIA